MRLTIAIPTYDRNALLRRNVEGILPQLDDRCELVILDNLSPTPVAETLADLICRYPNANVQLIRNTVNLGCGGNIMRCFEVCSGEWIWVLGDDDFAAPDAVATIYRHLDTYPQAIFMNFLTPAASRTAPYCTTGAMGFAEGIDHFGNMLSTSAGIFRVQPIRDNMRIGYHYIYSQAMHIALLLTILGEDGVCCFSDGVLIEEFLAQPNMKRWSVVNFAVDIATLLDMPLSAKMRETLAPKLVQDVRWPYLFDRFVAAAAAAASPKDVLYIYDQVCRRQLYFERNPVRGVLYRLMRFMVARPALGEAALNAYRRLRGKGAAKLVSENRLERL